MITRAVGTEPDVDVDTFTVEVRDGDLYLLCSDGLTDMLRDDDVLAAVAEADGEPERAAESLVRAANDAGGVDNVTVVLFEVVERAPVEEAAEAPETPLERTVEDVSAALPAGENVAHHGAGAGSRAAALSAIGLLTLAALLVLWWSIGR